MDTVAPTFTTEEQQLWERIAAHPFENPSVDLDFTGRLARTMGWSLETARAGIKEYRRFCFLAAHASEPMTPSEEIDEIWHLHLTYSRDYWEVWCKQVLGRTLHHDPTVGGASEQSRFRAQYAETLALYETYFGPPDAQFWPGLHDRFRPRYRVIDSDRTLTLPRPTLRAMRMARGPALAAVLALASVTPASAEFLDVLDWKGDRFLSFYVQLLLGAFALAFVVRWLVRGTGRPAIKRNLSPVEVAYLTGGAGRAADTLVIELSTCGAATVTASPPRIRVSTARADLPRSLQPFRSLEQGTYTRAQFMRVFQRAAATQRMRFELADGNLILDRSRNLWCTAATLSIMLPVIALGAAKTIVGLGRDKPVGFLIMLILIASGGLLATAFRRRRVTPKAKPRWPSCGRRTIGRYVRRANARCLSPSPSRARRPWSARSMRPTHR